MTRWGGRGGLFIQLLNYSVTYHNNIASSRIPTFSFHSQYDLGAEATIAGLNIIGKLLVPTNYKSTLTTTHVFVQGELEMSDTNPISEDNTSMKIVLTGSTDVMFTPHEPVAGAAPLNAGVKPFLVAGGKLNIHAWNEGEGVAWTPLLSMAEADQVYVDPITSPPEDATKALTPPPRVSDPSISCPSLIVDDFTNGYDPEIWSGGEGGILSFDETTGVLTETNLKTDWRGFRHDFTKFILDCPLIAGATYLVTIRLKIDDPNLAEGALTSCAQGLGSCPRIGRQLITPTSNSHSHRPVSHLASPQCSIFCPYSPYSHHSFFTLVPFSSLSCTYIDISSSYWSKQRMVHRCHHLDLDSS